MPTRQDKILNYSDIDISPIFTSSTYSVRSWDPWFPEIDGITTDGFNFNRTTTARIGGAVSTASYLVYLYLPEIKDVIFNDPATIVYWEDGTKTVVKCQKETGDSFSKETGLVMAIAKKALGNKGNFNDILKKWIKD